jgi:hypothetical protein
VGCFSLDTFKGKFHNGKPVGDVKLENGKGEKISIVVQKDKKDKKNKKV